MKKHLLLLSLLMVIQVSFGQEQSRPKIGLVLSGGGAKGLAHIGVLKVIDSLGIKVDYMPQGIVHISWILFSLLLMWTHYCKTTLHENQNRFMKKGMMKFMH